MGKPVSNRSNIPTVGRRAFLCGGALVAGAALGGCGLGRPAVREGRTAMGKPVSNRSNIPTVGRRAFLCGGALVAGAALGALAGCGQDSEPKSEEAEGPAAPADDAGASAAEQSLTVLNEVVYPEAVSSDDYEKRQEIVDGNPLSDEFVNGLSLFADDVACYGLGQSDAENGPVNLCFSPVGLYLALAMLAQGAGGNTQAQLLDALGVSDAATLAEQCGNLMRVLWSYTTPGDDVAASVMELATSLWVRADAPVETPFLQTATDAFYAEVFEASAPGATVERAMGTWIADHTGSTLKPELKLDESWLMSLLATVWFKDGWQDPFNANDTASGKPELKLDESWLMSLLATVWFKDGWQDPFNANDTASGTFHAVKGDVTCDFMTLVRECPVVQNDTYAVAALPLGTGSSVTFLLPAEGVDPRSLLARATGNGMIFDLSGEDAAMAQVTYRVPRLSFDVDGPVDEVLKAMGITDAFEDGADLSALTQSPAKVSSVEQGTHFSLNEVGVEASSYTAVGINVTSMPPQDMEEVTFSLDRPFAFRLTSPEGAVLFVGIVGDPS